MKAIIRTAVIFSIVAIGISVFAKGGNGQEKGFGKGRDKNIGKHIEKIKDELGLTESQSAQIRSIIDASKAEIKNDVQAMKDADTKEERQAARAELKKDQDAMREKILSVLTPEQRAKAQEMRGMFKDKMKDKKDKRGHKHDRDDDDDDDDQGTAKQGGSSGGTAKVPPSSGGSKSGSGGQGQTKK